MARRISRSTATALAFMATSIAPVRPPNRKTAITPAQTVPAQEMKSSVGRKIAAVTRLTVREPKRAICEPAIGMKTSEPIPKTRMMRPSALSLRERRAANSGILGAHDPIMNPFIKNSRETPIR